MESIGSSLFLIVLIGGLFLLIKRKIIWGIILSSIAILFLYVVPYLSFLNFKKSIYGKYKSENGKLLTIFKDNTYSIYQNDRMLDTSDLEITSDGDWDINFKGQIELEMNRSNGTFENRIDKKFYRIED